MSEIGPKVDRFLLTFDGVDDPTKDQVMHVIDTVGTVADAPAEVVIPGVIAFQGPPSAAEEIAKRLPSWRVAQEGRLSAHPPHKTSPRPRKR